MTLQVALKRTYNEGKPAMKPRTSDIAKMKNTRKAEMSDHNTTDQHVIVCPHCGHRHDDSHTGEIGDLALLNLGGIYVGSILSR